LAKSGDHGQAVLLVVTRPAEAILMLLTELVPVTVISKQLAAETLPRPTNVTGADPVVRATVLPVGGLSKLRMSELSEANSTRHPSPHPAPRLTTLTPAP